MNIKPFDTTVKTLLESGFYKIPRFQRPYSWDRENLEDFWQDTIVSEDEDYFIGSFVLVIDPSQDDLYLVVDGQQRLATLTILFAALRDSLIDLNEESLGQGIHKLIERPDINNLDQYVLQSETPYPFLQEFIQKLGDPEVDPDIGSEEKAIQNAYEFLHSKLSSQIQSVDLDTTISEKKKVERKKESLLRIRDKLLRLKLIVVELDDEDDAYIIFETLNTRGKDLTVSDLVKNHITRLLRPKSKGVDISKDKWLGIQKLFDKAEVDININNFIHHAWLSKRPYTSRKKLFKEIKKQVDSKTALDYLDSLVEDSSFYRKILEPRAYKWSKQDRAIYDSLTSLNIFRVAQPLPMVLSILRCFEKDQITKKQASKAFVAMENFHAQFTAVTTQRTGGGTAQMYASSARQLFDSSNKDRRMGVIREFVEKLRDRVPSYEEFEANFVEIFFTSTQTKQRSIIRYLLKRFDQNWRSGSSAIDYDQLTIEHIAPESGGRLWSVSEEKIGMVGNLILVTEEVNGQLSNKSFQEKIPILKDAHIPMDDYLSNAKDWDDECITDRTKSLSKLAFDTIFKF